MTKTKILVLLLAISFIIGGCGESPIEIEQGNRIVVDGEIGEEEWYQAQSFQLESVDNVDAKVMYKHDKDNLLIAYITTANPDEHINYPEIVIDPKNNDGIDMQDDDFWFHVSDKDCYAKGKVEDYLSNCFVESGKWTAGPNFGTEESLKPINIVEIEIPLDLVGIEMDKPFGMAITLGVGADKRTSFPENIDLENPSTWGTFILKRNEDMEVEY